MRCLIVDDDYPNRIKLKSLLQSLGDCDAVGNGAIALEMFEQAHIDLVPYDLITMDIEMPGMKGEETVSKIRAREKEMHITSPARIVMVTVKNEVDGILESFERGCEWYLVKPVTPTNLGLALEQLGLAKNPWPEPEMEQHT